MKNTFYIHTKRKKVKSMFLKEKGITLIALIVTIILLLILASVAIYSGSETIISSHFTKFSTDLKVMQTKVNEWYQEYKDGEEEILELGSDLTISSTVEKQANIVFTTEESGISSKDGYRYFSANDLQDLGIEGIDRDFFINIEKRSVVSFMGYDYENNRYYTIEQLENGGYNVDYTKNTGTPTFDVSYEQVQGEGFKIKITNIKYQGNINKWYVRYQKEGDTNWTTTENTEFIVSDAGNYNIILENGNVSGTGRCEIKADTLDSVTGYETANTKVKDNLGNEVWIPAGFKVQNPSANVEDGIIIEDVSHINTKGSTFVWVPVGKFTTSKGTKEIVLDKYSFNSSTGAPQGQGGTVDSQNANFKSSVEQYKGYYIAQYEARDASATSKRTSSSSVTNQVVSIKDKYVYNQISRDQAKVQSEKMYADNNFKSELINVYAWDTTLVFIQECSQNTKYSLEYSKNSGTLAEKGTDLDEVRNIFDMTSNCFELTTESSSSGYAVGRGGSYQYATFDNACSRNTYNAGTRYEYASFRPILYLN